METQTRMSPIEELECQFDPDAAKCCQHSGHRTGRNNHSDDSKLVNVAIFEHCGPVDVYVFCQSYLDFAFAKKLPLKCTTCGAQGLSAPEVYLILGDA